jgi:hypothetical protein
MRLPSWYPPSGQLSSLHRPISCGAVQRAASPSWQVLAQDGPRSSSQGACEGRCVPLRAERGVDSGGCMVILASMQDAHAGSHEMEGDALNPSDFQRPNNQPTSAQGFPNAFANSTQLLIVSKKKTARPHIKPGTPVSVRSP